MNSYLPDAVLILVLLLLLGILAISILYFLNLQDVLKEVDGSRRQVPPVNVWLMFIPLFNLIYPFILYPKICDSIKAEYLHRGLAADGDFGRGIGIAMPILTLVGIIPFIGILASLTNLVLLIIFWVKMAGYKEKLRETTEYTSIATEVTNE